LDLTFEKTYSVLESYRDNISIIELWDNGIVYFKIDDNIQIELEDSTAHFNYLKSKYDGKTKFIVLVETGRDTSISKEAREHAADPGRNEMTLACAVMVKSLAHRLVINFIINFTKQQTTKMRMFDNKQKAIDWLLSFK
jgi:hypothetical protein